jgi:pimeloyl-ACP methyl ester carboxylesterase
MERPLPNLPHRLFLAIFASFTLAATVRADPPVEPPVIPFEVAAPEGHIAGEIHQIPGSRPDTILVITGGSGVGVRTDTAAAIGLFLSETTAVAIYDRRGFGDSSGTATIPTTSNTAWLVPALGSDLLAITSHLDGLGYDRIGILGSSMGGWVNASAAARSDLIDFAINLVGGATSVSRSDTFDALTDTGLSIEAALAMAPGQAGSIGYDPACDLARASIPMLWVLGERDDSNPSQLDIEVIERLATAGQPYRYILVEQADHNFLNVESGEIILDWVPDTLRFMESASR